MAFRKEIDEHFRFLVLEVTSQVQEARMVIEGAEDVSTENIDARDDYIDNLKGLIESKAFSQVFHIAELDKPTVDLVKAIVIITTNLERIADYAVNIVGQMKYYNDKSFIKQYDYGPMFEEAFEALEKVYRATFGKDIKLALEICRAELRLDELYYDVFHKIRNQLRATSEPEDLLTSIFIFRYLERIGDCLLNVGEAVISAVVGEKLKIHQFQALEEALEGAQISASIDDFFFESIWETRSGCRIARVKDKAGANSTAVIFKEGKLRKVQSEKQAIERWAEISPGTVPKVFSFQQHGENGSLLLEYLTGRTFKELILGSDETFVRDALKLIARTLLDVWTATKEVKQVNAMHFKQLLDRIGDVHKVHPNYKFPGDKIGSLKAPSFEEMLSQASHFEKELNAPFSVLIHGDLNIDNVIYDENERRIHFIDLHRSTNLDYVQDVSVFIVSNFRLPVLDEEPRSRLNWVAEETYRIAHGFAEDNDDQTFDARLTLGLIRSFATSTRFELEEEFAKMMYLRAIFLLEKMLDHQGRPWSEFKLPKGALVQ